MATYDQPSGKSSAERYAGRNCSCREKTSADQSSASAVHPVTTWCQYSHPLCCVMRNAMMISRRARYIAQVTANHAKCGLR